MGDNSGNVWRYFFKDFFPNLELNLSPISVLQGGGWCDCWRKSSGSGLLNQSDVKKTLLKTLLNHSEKKHTKSIHQQVVNSKLGFKQLAQSPHSSMPVWQRHWQFSLYFNSSNWQDLFQQQRLARFISRAAIGKRRIWKQPWRPHPLPPPNPPSLPSIVPLIIGAKLLVKCSL